MKNTKPYFPILLGLFLLVVPISFASVNIEETNSNIENLSTAAAPAITDIGGGIHTTVPFDYWENFTGNGPWEFGSYESWKLFWYVKYTSDAPVSIFNYNTTYGSLDAYNGSFTPLNPTHGPVTNDTNKMVCDVVENPDVLVNFGWEVKVWIEDSDGLVSAPVTKLFKYNNGTIEDPEEELIFTATAERTVVGPSDDIVVNFDVTGPLTYQWYYINYTVDYLNINEITGEGIGIYTDPTQFIFQPYPSAEWSRGRWLNFEFYLYEFESGDYMNTSLTDTVSVYVGSPPENGTCTATFLGKIDLRYHYNITCSGWMDDIDESWTLFYQAISQFEIDNPDWNSMGYGYLHNDTYEPSLGIYGTYDTNFEIWVDSPYTGECFVRIYDSHGLFTQVALGYLGEPPEIPRQVPGYPIYLVVLSIVSVVSLMIWKIKKKQK